MKTFMKTIAALICVLCMGAASVKATAAIDHPALHANANGRYIMSGYVFNVVVFPSGIQMIEVEDSNGDLWQYSYASWEETPHENQRVTLIMNVNRTPADITNDIIEDILWCDCKSAAEED